MQGSYNPILVAISLIVAILAAFTALDLAGRVSNRSDRNRGRWLLGGSLAMGIGIWSMHFIGMLAFSLPIALGYDLAMTLYSLLVAVLVSAFALWLTSRAALPWPHLAAGSLLMGLGIAAMHYLGMDALRMQPGIDYDGRWLAASIAIAIAASAVALWITFRLRDGSSSAAMRLLAATAMGGAIVGMHYTGMAAAYFPANSYCGAARADGLPTLWLAVLVTAGTLATTAMSLGVSLLDRRFRRRTQALTRAMARTHQELAQVTLHDPLTGLPNRLLLHDRIRQGIERARRGRRRLAVLFMDLDGFEGFNARHDALLGDALLVVLVRRLDGLRHGEDALARAGGDEFVVVAEVDDAGQAAARADALLAAVRQPVVLEQVQLRLAASIGIALYPHDGESERQLLANADAAMYRAKAAGGDRRAFFDAGEQARQEQQGQLARELAPALAGNVLALGYRRHGEVALAVPEWRHPRHGTIDAARLAALAGQAGLGSALAGWMLTEACHLLQAWRRDGRVGPALAVPLSGAQLADPSLREQLGSLLARHAIEPGRLLVALRPDEAGCLAEPSVQALASLGIELVVDGLGADTRVALLARLQHLPLRRVWLEAGTADASALPQLQSVLAALALPAATAGPGPEVVAAEQLSTQPGAPGGALPGGLPDPGTA